MPSHNIASEIASFFADDNNFEESDEDNRPTDNNNLQHSTIPGGLEKPDCSQMTMSEAMFAMDKYQKERKAYGSSCKVGTHGGIG